MGYYSTIEEFPAVTDKNGLLKALKALTGEMTEWIATEDNPYGFDLKHLKRTRSISFPELCGKWHDTETIAKVLAPFVSGNWVFTGEDGSIWGFVFEKGKIYYLDATLEKGDLIK